MHVVINKVTGHTFVKYKYYTPYNTPFSSSCFKKRFSNLK